MSEQTKNRTKLFSYICVGLMVIALLLQFLPYWSCEGDAASMMAYMWFPFQHKTLASFFEASYEGYYINYTVNIIALVDVFSVVGIIFCMKKSTVHWFQLLCLGAGLSGIVGYLIYPVFQDGSMFIVHMAVFAIMIIVPVASVLISALASLNGTEEE